MNSLLFIYNAKSGLINSVFDIGHNTFSENKTWKDFRKQSNLNMAFYHIDEFEQEYPGKKFTYPVIVLKDSIGLTEFISSAEINKIENIGTL